MMGQDNKNIESGGGMGNGKTYIEHLRRVHFTLVVVALGLVMTILLSQPTEISRAISDLEKIQRIDSLWNSSWLMEHAFARYPELKSVSHLPRTARIKFNRFCNVTDLVFRLEIRPSVVDRSISGKFNVSKVGLGYNTTLANFRHMWDNLGEGLDVLLPCEGSLNGGEVEVVLWDNEGDQDIAITVDGEVEETSNLKHTGNTPVLTLVFTDSARSYGMSYGGAPPKYSSTAPFLYASVTRWDKADDQWLSALLGQNAPASGEVLISISGYRSKRIHGQSALDKYYGVGFERYGPFEEAFRELDALTSDIQNVNLESLAQVLENERKRTSESFQAFGLKVPAKDLSRWGSPLVVVIQLYFLLRLRTLVSMLDASERQSAPWIGIYNDSLSQVTTVISAVMLPPAVVIVLQWDTWPSQWIGWLWNVTPVVASTALAGFTATTLYKFHRELAT